MKFNNRENECVKTEDGRTVWLSRSPAVAATILAFSPEVEEVDCHVLAIKRGSAGDNEGKMCLPCGYLDWDENGTQAATREVFEETNLNMEELLENTKNWNSWDNPWRVNTDPESDQLQNVSFYYGAVFYFKGELPKTSNKNAEENEVEEVLWIPLREVKEYEWAFNHAERIEQFRDRAFL